MVLQWRGKMPQGARVSGRAPVCHGVVVCVPGSLTKSCEMGSHSANK